MTGEKDHKPEPLREGVAYAPVTGKRVSLAFGVDYVDGAIVIRLPDGTLERIRLKDE